MVVYDLDLIRSLRIQLSLDDTPYHLPDLQSIELLAVLCAIQEHEELEITSEYESGDRRDALEAVHACSQFDLELVAACTRRRQRNFRLMLPVLVDQPNIGLALHTTNFIDPRVIATYKCCALMPSVLSTTATSASSPFSSSVLPTARLGSGRPNNRFSSRTRLAASESVTFPAEAARSALSTP